MPAAKSVAQMIEAANAEDAVLAPIVKTVGKFEFSLDFVDDVPEAPTSHLSGPREPALPFGAWFSEALSALKSATTRKYVELFVPVSFWLTPVEEGGRLTKTTSVENASKPAFSKTRVRAVYNKWVEANIDERGATTLLAYTRKDGDRKPNGSTYPDDGVSFFLQVLTGPEADAAIARLKLAAAEKAKAEAAKPVK